MKFWLSFLTLAILPLMFGAALSAQSSQDRQEALREAKEKAAMAEARSETLRQEAANASRAVDRLVAQRAVLSAEIDAANAQIEAANARIAIISRRQQQQRSRLGQASEPMLRLNAALLQMTGRPTALMMAQPGGRSDYVHLRAVMATVEPQIRARTASLRQQIIIQKDLRSQELLALRSLNDAKLRLADQREALAKLEGNNRNRFDSLSADAAIEFEQAIAQGERARDIVERIDTLRLSSEKSSALAALQGPVMRPGAGRKVSASGKSVYMLPAGAEVVFGFSELNGTGYRERGVRLRFESDDIVGAPAAGKVTFAGNYRSYGKIVIIEHGGGWTSLVTNFDTLAVDVGDILEQGAALGTVSAVDPEVTIELRRNGRTMDIAAIVS